MNIELFHSSLLDLFLKSSVLLTLALLMMAAFRRASAANRHAIAAATFVALLLLPGTKLLSPQWSFDWNQRSALSDAKAQTVHTEESEISHPATLPAEAALPMVEPWLDISWQTMGVVAWLCGVMLFLTRRFWISLRLSAVVRGSSPLKTGRLVVLSRKVVEASGVNAEVRLSHECRVPLVSGILRPLVLLPVEVEAWSEELISAALQHELGHIRRRDCFTRLLANIVCAIYWVNPLVWLAARKLRLLQEHACDDLVLNAGLPAEEYATQLVTVVRNLQGNPFISRHAMAMAQPSTLETRVRAIVDETRDRSPRVRRGVVAGLAFVSSVLMLCATAQVCGAVEKKDWQVKGNSSSIVLQDNATPLNVGIEMKAQTGAGKTTSRTSQISIESRFVEISEDAAQSSNSVPLPEGLESLFRPPGLISVLTEKQVQAAFRQLEQRKGVDLLTVPTLRTRSNQAATVEVAREFVYPSEYEKDKLHGGVKPKNFETKKVGVTLGVTAMIQPDKILDLNLKPQIVEFEGFIKGKNGEEQPIFNERKLSVDVSIFPGQTVVMGMKTRTDTQLVEDRVWFFFKKNSTRTINRRVLVFVTAKIINPGDAEKP